MLGVSYSPRCPRVFRRNQSVNSKICAVGCELEGLKVQQKFGELNSVVLIHTLRINLTGELQHRIMNHSRISYRIK